jgi:HEAT repeat protein
MSQVAATRLDQLLEAVHDWEDVDRAVAASEALEAEATEEWLPRLREVLTTGRDCFVREAAAWPVARLDRLRSLPLLLTAQRLGTAERHDNDGLNTAIVEVVEADPVGAVPVLLQRATSESDADRQDAAWLLGFVHEHVSPEPLIKLSSDVERRVRSAALGSLASYSGDQAVYAALIRGLTDPSEDVAASAASALGYFGDRRAFDAVSALRRRVSAMHRDVLVYALEQLAAAGP